MSIEVRHLQKRFGATVALSGASLEAKASAALPATLYSYIAGGAGDELTQRRNVEAFEDWGVVPRMLVGATERDLSVHAWGLTFSSPIFMSPVGTQARADQEQLTAWLAAINGGGVILIKPTPCKYAFTVPTL